MPYKYRMSRLTELLLRIMDMGFVSCSYSKDLKRSHQVNRRLPTIDRRQSVNPWPEALFECILSSPSCSVLNCAMPTDHVTIHLVNMHITYHVSSAGEKGKIVDSPQFREKHTSAVRSRI